VAAQLIRAPVDFFKDRRNEQTSTGGPDAAAHSKSRMQQDPPPLTTNHSGLDAGFFVAYLLCAAIVMILLPVGGKVEWAEAAPALALQLIVGIVLGLNSRHVQFHRSATFLGIAAYLVSVALLRDAAVPTSGYGPLVLLPAVWAALRGRRVEVGAAVVGVAAVYFIPALLIGAPKYPAGGWRAGMLLVVLAAATGFAIVQLVERVGRLVHQLQELATRDGLTGLTNKRAWQELFEHELASSRRSGEPLTVALIDLNLFKQYNDQHGHLAGDRLLSEAAAAWHGALRETDVLARWGGDEFGLLLPGCTRGHGEITVERMRAAFPQARFSAGVVEWDRHASAEELLDRADGELYRAKRADRERVAV
jgi:diguanylate cyclase (GGDEF)-like protein